MRLVPLWTNLIVRIYGWFIILGRKGFINTILLQADLIEKPLPMIFNSFSVVIGLLDVVFPWVLLILISVLEGIDWSMIEAARDLGAGRFKSFYEVTFKLSIPGMAVAGLFAFVWAMGEYAVPSLLGSSSQRTISIEVADQILSMLNWPFGASIAFTLFTISVLVLIVSNRISQKGARYMS
jgi:ABC-type spermidine/putrescine transport system permease subunit I